jgi:uncharacterized protein HemX
MSTSRLRSFVSKKTASHGPTSKPNAHECADLPKPLRATERENRMAKLLAEKDALIESLRAELAEKEAEIETLQKQLAKKKN